MLAAIYHTVLYIHRRTALLLHYSIYLWVTFVYVFFRFIHPNTNPQNQLLLSINPDETLQMLSFAFYIRFMGVALELDKIRERHAVFYVTSTPYIILAYALLQIISVNTNVPLNMYLGFKFLIRIYLLFVGLFMLLKVILRRKKIFYNYLAAGALSIIIFGVISTMVNIIGKPGFFVLGAISWLMLGFFTDVLFFSSAIGYRIKSEAIEKEGALKKLIEQNELLQQKELEKMEAIYETKEQERQRIASDLHDDIGASLSSLQIYSTIAEQSINTQPEKTVNMLQKITGLSKRLLENMGDIVWSMNPVKEHSTTLEAKIKNFGAELLGDKSINVVYNIEPGVENILKGIAVRKNILLLLKEAMNNIAKYSKAENASISLTSGNGCLLLDIKDDGKGFDITAVSQGNGLKNMRYRVNELQGNLVIASAEKSGTHISATIPLHFVNAAE